MDRLLNDDGVFIFISYGNPEQRLHYIEQYDIDEPYFTPWVVEVQALSKFSVLLFFMIIKLPFLFLSKTSCI